MYFKVIKPTNISYFFLILNMPIIILFMLTSDFLNWLKEFCGNYLNNIPPAKNPQLLGMKLLKLFNALAMISA